MLQIAILAFLFVTNTSFNTKKFSICKALRMLHILKYAILYIQKLLRKSRNPKLATAKKDKVSKQTVHKAKAPERHL